MRQTFFHGALTIALAITFSAFSPKDAHAGTISAFGSVTALTDVSQLKGTLGTADFDGYTGFIQVPLNSYAAQGLMFHNEALSTILAGVTAVGTASTPLGTSLMCSYFPSLAGGGSSEGSCEVFGGVATFTTLVTQVGMTISQNGNQFLTAWGIDGALLGQVNWVPNNDSSFFGIDTGGVAIGMVALGNDDVFDGEEYDVGGNTIISDSWKWASGSAATSVPEPASLALVALGLAGIASTRRKRKN